MTKFPPAVVAEVRDALMLQYDFVGPCTAERCAVAALEASDLAGLVDALDRITFAYMGGDWTACRMAVADGMAVLAKARGEA